MEDILRDCLNQLSQEARELYLSPSITVLDTPPSPLVFYREYVSKNRPVIIKNALTEWEAFSKWTNDYLLKSLGTLQVSVTVVTISGSSYGDDHIEWASQAFGAKPDAVNFWMGNADSITSMHKDHYENLYTVIRGQKTFILHPPTDIPHIPYETYKVARYQQNNDGVFEVIDIYKDNSNSCIGSTDVGDSGNFIDEDSSNLPKNGKTPSSEFVSWIAIDPLDPDFEKYPQYANSQQYIANICPGDVLYLPSMWFHHVTQSDQTIALNFWYDMEYDIKYNYFKFAEALSKAAFECC